MNLIYLYFWAISKSYLLWEQNDNYRNYRIHVPQTTDGTIK